jgi:hypothetical protein
MTRVERFLSVAIRLAIVVLVITAMGWIASLIADGCRPLRPAERMEGEARQPDTVTSPPCQQPS